MCLSWAVGYDRCAILDLILCPLMCWDIALPVLLLEAKDLAFNFLRLFSYPSNSSVLKSFLNLNSWDWKVRDGFVLFSRSIEAILAVNSSSLCSLPRFHLAPSWMKKTSHKWFMCAPQHPRVGHWVRNCTEKFRKAFGQERLVISVL